MKQRLYLIPIIFILSAIGYVIAYYLADNPRPEEDIAKDWANIEAVARLRNSAKGLDCPETLSNQKKCSRFAKVSSDPFTLQQEFSSEWSELINAENDLYYEDGDAFLHGSKKKLVGRCLKMVLGRSRNGRMGRPS